MAKGRLARALRGFTEQWRRMMHWPLPAQHERLCRMLRGYFAYFGITDNSLRLRRLRYLAERCWRRWLARRTRDHQLTWSAFTRILRRFPLPPPLIVHCYTRP